MKFYNYKTPDPDPVSFPSAKCDRATSKAIKAWCPEFGEYKWIPRSVIHDDSEVYGAGHKGTLIVMGWWAEKNGLL